MLTTDAFIRFVEAYARRLADLQNTLNMLDNQIGDGDHGTNMARGFKVAAGHLANNPGADLGAVCNTVAMALLGNVGGASGPLYATIFMRFSALWKGQSSVHPAAISNGISSALDGLRARGKAEMGDKTMVDVWGPVNDGLREDEPTDNALITAVATATSAALETKSLIAKKGRASYLGERSVGTCDPGSISSAVFFEELVDAAVGGVERSEWHKLVS